MFQSSNDLFLADVVWVIGAAITIEGGYTLLDLLAGDIFENLVVAWEAAAIFWWASPFTAEELGIQGSWIGRLEFFDDDAVLPVVAHVVDVHKVRYAVGHKRRQFGRCRVGDPSIPIWV